MAKAQGVDIALVAGLASFEQVHQTGHGGVATLTNGAVVVSGGQAKGAVMGMWMALIDVRTDKVLWFATDAAASGEFSSLPGHAAPRRVEVTPQQRAEDLLKRMTWHPLECVPPLPLPAGWDMSIRCPQMEN